MTESTLLSSTDYVAPVPGSNVVYVIVDDRQKFAQINRPETAHAPLPDGRVCLSKTIGNWLMSSDEGLVIFQHWLPADPAPATEVKGAVQWNG